MEGALFFGRSGETRPHLPCHWAPASAEAPPADLGERVVSLLAAPVAVSARLATSVAPACAERSEAGRDVAPDPPIAIVGAGTWGVDLQVPRAYLWSSTVTQHGRSCGGAHQAQILVVEDEERLADLIRRHLAMAGFEVHAELRGTSALRYAAEHRPDLVLLDLRLPDIGGYELCRTLRKFCDRSVVPIVMVTAMNQPVDRLRGFAQGADAYVTKPFQLTELLETVSLLLEQARMN